MLTRRGFLQSSLALIPAGAMLPQVFQRGLFTAGLEWGNQQAPSAQRTLVVVELAGGNDGLNTVVPYTDGAYYDARPGVAIAQNDVLPLDDEIGLHPALLDFVPLWQEGHLAIVEGVGYFDQSYSHFESRDIWQSGQLTGRLEKDYAGWLGRYFTEMPPSTGNWFDGMAIGKKIAPALYTPEIPIPTVQNVKTYQFQEGRKAADDFTEARIQALLSLYAAAPRAMPHAALLDNTMQAAYNSTISLQTAHSAYTPSVDYPDNKFAQGLRVIAEAITQNLGLRVGHVSLGGFDTHANEIEDHNKLLTYLGQGITAFYQDLVAHGKDKDVLIMTWSEFGRRFKSNGSEGTDHGAASSLFLLGTPVRGGLYGQRPDLTRLDFGNLRYTTDFRSVYKTVLDEWLQAPGDVILRSKKLETLGFLNKTPKANP